MKVIAPTRQTPRVIVPESDDVVVPPGEIVKLRSVERDGAWTPAEVSARLTQPEALYRAELLTLVDTPMGQVSVLTPRGYALTTGRAQDAPSVNRQLDRAYVRLSILALGWKAVGGEGRLRQYDKTGRMVEVETPFGAALVVGRLPSGYSSAGIRTIISRLKSQALSKDFFVVVLTPRPRRGQRFAARHPAWLQVVSICPRVDGGETKPDGEARGWGSQAPPPGPQISPGDEQRYLDKTVSVGRPYGQLWVSILKRPRVERVQAALAALRCDGVLAEQQLRRIYDLDRRDLDGVPYIDAVVRPVHSRQGLQVSTRFFLREAGQRHLGWNALSHAAGVAEMRLLLNIPPDPAVWQTTALGRTDMHRPDAIYHSPDGPVAVEYDTGSYTAAVVQTKLELFRDRGFADTIWGVPGATRRHRLSRELSLETLHARWF